MIQPELLALAAKIGAGIATAGDTKIFLVQFQARVAELRELVATLPKLSMS